MTKLPAGTRPDVDVRYAYEQMLLDNLMTRFEEVIRDQTASMNATQLRGVARPAPVNSTGGPVSRSAGSFIGFSLRETSGINPATVTLFDHDADGPEIMSIQLAPGESTREWFQGGIGFLNGLHVQITTGVVDGTVFIRAGDPS